MNSTDDIDTANGDLAQLLGLEKVAEPQGTLPELPDTLADKISNNVNQRPDVSALMSRTEANRLEGVATLSHWVPRVNLFGEYEYYNNRNDQFDDWKNFRNAYEIGVRLNWNLFDGFADHAKNREAVDRSIEAQKTLRMAQLKAAQDVALWKRKFKYFNSVYRARQGDIGKAKEAVRLAREGRRVGSRTNTDLLDAETDLHRSQAGAIHAQLGVIEALINLELATGQKLYEFN
jgi:outer membrane protein TolC